MDNFSVDKSSVSKLWNCQPVLPQMTPLKSQASEGVLNSDNPSDERRMDKFVQQFAENPPTFENLFHEMDDTENKIGNFRFDSSNFQNDMDSNMGNNEINEITKPILDDPISYQPDNEHALQLLEEADNK